MKILVIGSDGFIGRNLVNALKSEHGIYKASIVNKSKKIYQIDLLKPETVSRALDQIKPQVIVNCAGIVDNSEKANLNSILIRNLLDGVVSTKLKPKKIIVLGSAAEYGIVGETDTPVVESTPLRADSIYGLSKVNEMKIANEYRKQFACQL